jgi:hypothetical protein
MSLLFKNSIRVPLPFIILKKIWFRDSVKSIEFLINFIRIHPEYKSESEFNYFMNDITYYPCKVGLKLQFMLEVFVTHLDFDKYLNDVTLLFILSMLTSKYKKDVNSKILYILLRRIYDYNPKLITSRVYNKILRDNMGTIYFCKTLHEKTYSICLQNNIKVEKMFRVHAN